MTVLALPARNIWTTIHRLPPVAKGDIQLRTSTAEGNTSVKQKERRDLYQEISDAILDKIEETGTLPWSRPWHVDKCGGPNAPFNAITGKPYRGLNSLFLSMHPGFFETQDPRFCTFLQAKEKGWTIKAGSKSVPIIFYKPFQAEGDEHPQNRDENGPAGRLIHLLRAYHVFSLGTQVIGAPPYNPPNADDLKWNRVEAPYTMLANMFIPVHERGERAGYSPELDVIVMPPHRAFKSPEAEAFVLLHEGAHGSGHQKRLNRDLSGKYGSIKYSAEEVLVDTTAALAGRVIGLSPDVPNHSAYIQTWAKSARADKKEVFRLSREAQKVADYLLSHIPGMELEPDPEDAPTPLDAVLPASSLPTQPAPAPL